MLGFNHVSKRAPGMYCKDSLSKEEHYFTNYRRSEVHRGSGLHRGSEVHDCAWTLQWHHNGCDGVSNHQPHDCLLSRLFRRRSKKTSKLRVTGICAGNSPVTSEFPAQRASDAEYASIWWRHHEILMQFCKLIRYCLEHLSARSVRVSRHMHIIITMMSHGRSGVSNHGQLDYLSNSMVIMIKENIKYPHCWSFVRGKHVAVTSGFSSQRACHTGRVFMWWSCYDY